MLCFKIFFSCFPPHTISQYSVACEYVQSLFHLFDISFRLLFLLKRGWGEAYFCNPKDCPELVDICIQYNLYTYYFYTGSMFGFQTVSKMEIQRKQHPVPLVKAKSRSSTITFAGGQKRGLQNQRRRNSRHL